MRALLLPLLLVCLLSAPAYAEEETVPVTEEDAPKAIPFRTDGGLTKAEGQLSEGKFTQALETAGGVLARHPGNPDALTYAGFAWMELGETEKAAEHFDRAIKYDPGHLGANYYRAQLYLEEGEFQRALEQMQAMRVVCAGADCAELNALQADLNRRRKGEKNKKEEKESKEEDADE